MDNSKCGFVSLALGLGLRAPEAAQQLDLHAIDLVDGGEPGGEARAKLREAVADLAGAAHFQHHVARERELLLDHGEDHLAHAFVLDQAGIVAGDVEIDQKQRLLHLVDDEAEQARILEQMGQQRLALLAAHLEQAVQSAAHAVPAGDDVAVLRPGEHPGDGAQIAERPRAEAARRARADIEQRDLLERARRLEILDEAGMGDEAGIGGAAGAGQRLQDVVELALRLQRLLALGFQRMLEHARGEQLHLIERGALIGIFIGHHLALLGDAEAPADRAGRLGGDGAAGGRAAA